MCEMKQVYQGNALNTDNLSYIRQCQQKEELRVELTRAFGLRRGECNRDISKVELGWTSQRQV